MSEIEMGTYESTLTAARKVGASAATDRQLMALFCAENLQRLVGAASPRLVWEGAQTKGLTSLALAELALRKPLAVHDLMWV